MLASRFLGPPLTRALVEASFDVADAGRLDKLADLEGMVARFERRVAEARDVSEGAAGLIRHLQDGSAERPGASELDAAIEVLLAAERSFAESLRSLTAKARQNEAEAAENAPHLLTLMQRMTALIEEEFQLCATAARDLRWAAMVLRAAGEPPADGPVLATPAEVSDFIRSLRTTH